jgi:transketolase
VIGYHSLKPFDANAAITAASETNGIITIEEHTIIGGLGSTVAEVCLEAKTTPGFFRRIGLNDQYPTIVGDQDYLRAAYSMDADAIVSVAKSALDSSLTA